VKGAEKGARRKGFLEVNLVHRDKSVPFGCFGLLVDHMTIMALILFAVLAVECGRAFLADLAGFLGGILLLLFVAEGRDCLGEGEGGKVVYSSFRRNGEVASAFWAFSFLFFLGF